MVVSMCCESCSCCLTDPRSAAHFRFIDLMEYRVQAEFPDPEDRIQVFIFSDSVSFNTSLLCAPSHLDWNQLQSADRVPMVENMRMEDKVFSFLPVTLLLCICDSLIHVDTNLPVNVKLYVGFLIPFCVHCVPISWVGLWD